MGKVALIARIILGLIFLVFGLNGFFQFLEMPPMSEEADAYLCALAATGARTRLRPRGVSTPKGGLGLSPYRRRRRLRSTE